MDIIIREVLTASDLKTFVEYPFHLYKDSPYWLPPLLEDEYNTLRRDKNPAFEHCLARYWLAERGGQVVGRVAAIHNRRHVEKWQQNYLRFGWLEMVDDPAVADALFGVVEGWASELGCTAIHGPLGFTDMDKEGMLIEGFDEMGTMATIYNPPYYPREMERLGFVKDVDWFEYQMTIPTTVDPEWDRRTELVLERFNLHLLNPKRKSELLAYAPALFGLIDSEYAHLYSTVPLTPAQVKVYTAQYFGFINPDFAPMLLNEKNELVGFAIAMPSLSLALRKANGRLFPFGFVHLLTALQKNDRADLYLIAVRSDYRAKGAHVPLMTQVWHAVAKRGITVVDACPELETNLAVRTLWKHFDSRQNKKRRAYIKHLAVSS